MMTGYTYKGFNVHYDIKPLEKNNNFYKADGYITCQLDEDSPSMLKKFHTEYPTKNGARNEIMKLVEAYIDFEWKEAH